MAMRGRGLFLLLLLLPVASLIATASQGAPVSKRGGAFVLSSGESLSLSPHRSLLIRQRRANASLPLPGDVTELLGVDEATTGNAIVLRLGRECPPDRKLTITHEALQARLLVATEEHGQSTAGLATLRRAVGLAPDQADLRLKLVRALLATGQAREAEQIFSEGMRATPFEMAWLARQGHEFAALLANLPAAKTKVDLQYRDGEAPPAGVAWSPTRRQAAFIDETWNLRVTAAGNSDVFEAALTLGPDLDASGAVSPAALRKVANRVAAAEAMLGQLGFHSLERARRVDGERNADFITHIRWKESGVVASAGDAVIRVRQSGKIVFEEKIDTIGTVGLDWGIPLPEESLLLLSWSRIVGSDTCPNGSGISQVPLATPPR